MVNISWMKHRKKEAAPADCEFAAVQVNMAIESGKQVNEEKFTLKYSLALKR